MRLVKPISLIITSLTLLLLASRLFIHLFINTTASMPLGFYQAIQEPLQRGDWVAVCLPKTIAAVGLKQGYLGGGNCPSGVKPVLKEIAAMPFDDVEVLSFGLAINHHFLPQTLLLSLDRKNRKLFHIPFGHYHLTSNQVWLLGKAPQSWDSRYYGPVPLSSIVTPVKALWVW